MDHFLIWLGIMGVMLWVINRRRTNRAGERAPISRQAYRKLERAEMPAPPPVDLEGGRWQVLSIEDLPTPLRRRAVMSVRVSPASLPIERVERLLWSLAVELQRRARAHVVVVEAFDHHRAHAPLAGAGLLRLLFAVDGLGWEGEEEVLAVVDGPQVEQKQYGLAEVQRRTLDAVGTPG